MNNNENIHNIVGDYKFGFKTDVKNVVDTGKGLTEDVVRQISKLKNEPEWMLEFRLMTLSHILFLYRENTPHIDW